MAVRRESEPLKKITMNIFAHDQERMVEVYGALGYTVAIRNLVRAHLSRIDRKIAEGGEALMNEIDMEEQIG